MGVGGEAGGDAPPEDPPRRPDRRFLVMREPLPEQRPRLFDAPGIEGSAESGAEEETAEGEEHPLVVGASPAFLRARPEDAPEIAIGRQRPGRAIAEHPLQVAPHVLRARVMDGLPPEDDLELLARRLDVARQL